MPKVNTYLSFDGSAADAMHFYQDILGAKLDSLTRFGDIPHASHTSPGGARKVMHSQLSFADGGTLMASDWIGSRPYEGMKGFSIAFSYESANEARRVFGALGQGGMTIMALQPSFFAETFGMLIDRFGAPWSVSGGPNRG
jgi:PhnB protein